MKITCHGHGKLLSYGLAFFPILIGLVTLVGFIETGELSIFGFCSLVTGILISNLKIEKYIDTEL